MVMPLSLMSFHFPVPRRLSAPHLSRQWIPCFVNTGSSGPKQRIFNLRSGSSKISACVGEDTSSLSNQSNNMTNDSPSAGILSKREFPPGVWKDDIIDSMMSSNKAAAAAATEKRMESLICEIKGMFRGMGNGETSPSAYDTACVARIPAVDGSDHPHFPQTLEWVIQNQLEDGSWGEEKHFLTYDRLLATLACVITLTLWRTGYPQVHKGIEFLKKHVGMIMMEDEGDNDRPSGFEIVFPAMLNEANNVGLDLPYELPSIKQMIQKREAKLKRISTCVLCTAPTKLLYYLEGLQEIVDWHKIIKLQSRDGSFLGSPASTAAVFMRTGNTKCLEFLNFVLRKFRNHVPGHYPLDLMERLWAVDTVERLGIDRHFKKEIKDVLDYVHSHWDERGIGWGTESVAVDIDVTAMGLRILRLHGYNCWNIISTAQK